MVIKIVLMAVMNVNHVKGWIHIAMLVVLNCVVFANKFMNMKIHRLHTNLINIHIHCTNV